MKNPSGHDVAETDNCVPIEIVVLEELPGETCRVCGRSHIVEADVPAGTERRCDANCNAAGSADKEPSDG